jgi:secondary thiamine-phosphate synthase enzyme
MSRFFLEVATQSEGQLLDLTRDIARHVNSLVGDGVLHLFVVGSTAGLTTIEYEPGLVHHDFAQMLERLAPADGKYDHEATWNDDNGHSHLRASMVGPSLTVPYGQGKLILGQWQQIVLCEFDTRPRRRSVVGTVLPAAVPTQELPAPVQIAGARSRMLAL